MSGPAQDIEGTALTGMGSQKTFCRVRRFALLTGLRLQREARDCFLGSRVFWFGRFGLGRCKRPRRFGTSCQVRSQV